MPSVTSAAGPIHLGMDTSKNTIMVGILMPGEEVPVIDRIWNDEVSVRHLIGRFGDPAALRCCYEAGPCGSGAAPAAGLDGSGLRCGRAVADPAPAR
jgi:hypothetical protein